MRHLNGMPSRAARWLLNVGIVCLVATPIGNVIFPGVPAILRYDATKPDISPLGVPVNYTSAVSYTIPFFDSNWVYILGIILIIISHALRLKSKSI